MQLMIDLDIERGWVATLFRLLGFGGEISCLQEAHLGKFCNTLYMIAIIKYLILSYDLSSGIWLMRWDEAGDLAARKLSGKKSVMIRWVSPSCDIYIFD